MRHNPGYGIMRELVRKRRIIVIEAVEQLRGRHRDPVDPRLIIGLAPVVPQYRRNSGKEGIEPFRPTCGLNRFKQVFGMEAFGQAIDLVDVEDGIGLQDPARLLGDLSGLRHLDLLRVALVKTGDRRRLAFANLTAQLCRLGIGHPGRRGEARALGRHPQPEDIHAPIGRAAGAQRSCDGQPPPGLDPGPGPGFQFLDDCRCNAGGGRLCRCIEFAGHTDSPE